MRKTEVLHSGRRRVNPVAVLRFRCVNDCAGRKHDPFDPSYPKGPKTMERVTLRIPKQQIEEVEQMVDTGEYPNRSEAIRSAVREMLSEQEGSERASEKDKRTWARV